jgi:uncharacterized protein (DUF58 family)
MKQNRWFKYIGIAAFALVLSAMAAPTAQALTVNGFVVRQSCVNGDIVAVTLSATVQPNVQVRYRWDFNNDGIFDTGLLLNPTVTHRYHDEVMRTARVMAVRVANGVRAFDRVTFLTRRCTGGGG